MSTAEMTTVSDLNTTNPQNNSTVQGNETTKATTTTAANYPFTAVQSKTHPNGLSNLLIFIIFYTVAAGLLWVYKLVFYFINILLFLSFTNYLCPKTIKMHDNLFYIHNSSQRKILINQ